MCPDPEQCPGRVYECDACGAVWREALDDCPRCQAGWKSIQVEHGNECPQAALLWVSMDSVRGHLIRRAQRWLDDLAAGFTVTLDEVSAEEYAVMELIREESAKVGAK